MRLAELCLLREAEDEPLTVSMLRRALSKHGRIQADFYVSSGRKNGWVEQPPEKPLKVGGDGKPAWRVAVRRHKAPHDSPIYATIDAAIWDTLTLKKFPTADGGSYIKLVNRTEKVKEGLHAEGQAPLWASIIFDGLGKDRRFYFAAGGNEIMRLDHSYKPGGFGHDFVKLQLENGKTGKKQTYTIASEIYDSWKLVKFKDGHALRMVSVPRSVDIAEGKEEPLIVTLMNRRLEKQGAVRVNLKKLSAGRLTGWIIKPLEPVPALAFAQGGPNQYKALVKGPRGGVSVFYFGADADSAYTLRNKKDMNNNPVIEVTNREAA